MHVWPELANQDVMAHLMAWLMSASFKTMNGSHPPNSRHAHLRCQPAISEMILPAVVLPVKLTPLISFLEIIDSVWSVLASVS